MQLFRLFTIHTDRLDLKLVGPWLMLLEKPKPDCINLMIKGLMKLSFSFHMSSNSIIRIHSRGKCFSEQNKNKKSQDTLFQWKWIKISRKTEGKEKVDIENVPANFLLQRFI